MKDMELRRKDWKDIKLFIKDLIEATIRVITPANLIKRYIKRVGDILVIEDKEYDLFNYKNIVVVGAGKASASMAVGIEDILKDKITEGFVIVKEGFSLPTMKIKIVEGSHPIPDNRSLEAGYYLKNLLSSLGEQDLVFALISGGGSALVEYPEEGITLEDLQELTKMLLHCGATIEEINTVRISLSQIKGGGLVKFARPAQIISFIISDVVEDDLTYISSGLTYPVIKDYKKALHVLEKYGLIDRVPSRINSLLQKKALFNNKEISPEQLVPFVKNIIIGNITTATQFVSENLRKHTYNTYILSNFVKGEAKEIGKFFGAIAKQVRKFDAPFKTPCCIITGGETTVTIKGKGRGGRNTELALSVAIEIDGLEDVIFVSFATDGNDGFTNAAGAIVDGYTCSIARSKGLNPTRYLENNDSYTFFLRLGDLIFTGPTYTNVNDIYMLIIR